MIDWVQFARIYTICSVPLIAIIILEIRDKILYRQYNSVHCVVGLKIICCLAALVSLLGGVSNGLDYIYFKDSELWFVVLMIICYICLIVVLIVMYNEKIYYKADKSVDVEIFKINKKYVKTDNISRIYLSDEFLDVYVGDERIRISNNFLKGAENFEKYVIQFTNIKARNFRKKQGTSEDSNK